MSAIDIFGKPLLLASKEFESCVNGLVGSVAQAEETCQRVMEDKLYFRFPEIEPHDYSPRRKLLLQLFSIIKQEPLSALAPAAILLASTLLRNSLDRFHQVQEAGIWMKISDIISRTHQTMSLELQRSVWIFMAVFASQSANECRTLLDKQYIEMMYQRMESKDMIIDYACFYVLKCISHVPELRPLLPSLCLQHCVTTLEQVVKMNTSLDAYYAIQTRSSAVMILRNMAAHSSDTKLQLHSTTALPSLVAIIDKDNDIDSATLYHSLYAIAHIQPTYTTEHETTTMFNRIRPVYSRLSKRLMYYLNQPEISLTKRASFYCLSHLLVKFPIHFGLIFLLETKGLPLLLKYLAKPAQDNDPTMNEMRVHCFVALRNLALIDKPSKIRQDFTRSLYSSLLTVLQDDTETELIHHHILCIFSNLTVDDVCSQLLGTPAFIDILYQKAQEKAFNRDALRCLANLCVDEPSCLRVLKQGKMLFSQLFVGYLSEIQRQDVICVMHNLIIQFMAALNFFVRVDGFLEEVMAALSSTDDIIQSCALQIIYCYLTKGTPKMKHMILQLDPVPPLMVQMHSEKVSSKNKTMASKCFQLLVQLDEKSIKNDHFTVLRAKWTEDDKARLPVKPNQRIK